MVYELRPGWRRTPVGFPRPTLSGNRSRIDLGWMVGSIVHDVAAVGHFAAPLWFPLDWWKRGRRGPEQMRDGLRLYNCRCNMQPNRIPVTEVARMKTYIETVLLSAYRSFRAVAGVRRMRGRCGAVQRDDGSDLTPESQRIGKRLRHL